MPKHRRHYLQHKETARQVIYARILHLNQHYRLPIRKVFIKNHKSRWGSCSERGNLNFNYRLALLPLPLVDYVIVHELCHLREFNHSPKFWSLVAEVVPKHKALRKRLMQIPLG